MTETTTRSLTDFLLERFAEDAAHPWHRQDCSAVVEDLSCDCDGVERLTAECEAKRALIDWAFVNASDIDGEWGDGCSVDQLRAGECRDHGSAAVTAVLSILARPYADHPDYRPEWSA